MRNKDVAAALSEIGILLEVEGKDKFKPKSYERAARSVENLGEDIEAIAARGELTSIPGIGEAIAKKIESFLSTGHIEALDSLRERIPVKVAELDAIPGMGPKTIKLLYDELGVTDIESLETALKEGRLKGLKGIGPKTEAEIANGIGLARSGIGRSFLPDALATAEQVMAHLRTVGHVRRIEVAGSVRRRKETVGDLDFLVETDDEGAAVNAFVGLEEVADVLAKGATKTSVRLRSGLQMDMRVIPAESFGAGLQYFTGSIDHNVHLRTIALKKGLELNEYGLFKGKKQVEGASEEGIYRALGLDYIPPELREDSGEIDAALTHTLPKLISLSDIRGDLHGHTNESDGTNTTEEMVEAAAVKKYDYYCISDHTKSLKIAHGLDEKRLLNRIQEIDELNSSGRWRMRILKGVEVDILANGELDMSDDVLAQLDVVTASVHSRMKDSKDAITERVCTALSNRNVHIFGHPTGRLILERPEYEIDLDRVFEAAKSSRVAMELNSHPHRLDLNPGNLRRAVKAGLKIAINTDAHSVLELENMKFGIFQACRGWIEPRNVLNTLPLKDLLAAIRK